MYTAKFVGCHSTYSATMALFAVASVTILLALSPSFITAFVAAPPPAKAGLSGSSKHVKNHVRDVSFSVVHREQSLLSRSRWLSPGRPSNTPRQLQEDHAHGDGDLGNMGAAATTEATLMRKEQMNLACNDVVRTILRQDPGEADGKALRARLEKQRATLVAEDDEMSVLFFENLLMVCEHELHPQVDRLQGEYGKAWKNILHYIEDAGWQLTDPPFSMSG